MFGDSRKPPSFDGTAISREGHRAKSRAWRSWVGSGPALAVAISLLVATVLALGFTLSRDAKSANGPREGTAVALEGTLTLYDGQAFAAEKGSCSGGGSGHEDLATGGQLTFRGPDGDVIGVVTLGEGSLDERGGCVMPFAVNNMKQVDFYQVSSQSTLRSGLTFARGDLAKADWQLPLTVGDEVEAARDSRADCLATSDVSVTAKVSVKPSTFGEDADLSGNWFGYTVRGDVRNLTDTDVDVQFYWEVVGWDAFLSSFEPATDVMRDMQLGATDTEDLMVKPRASESFTASGISQVGGLMGGPKPQRVNVRVQSVTTAGSGAVQWCG